MYSWLIAGLLSAADLIQHLAVSSHGLHQVLHHSAYTSCNKVVGIRPPHSGQPFGQHHSCCSLLADDSTHLADGQHTADQVILDSHILLPPIESGKLTVNVLQQSAVGGNGLLNLFFCGLSHIWEPPKPVNVMFIGIPGTGHGLWMKYRDRYLAAAAIAALSVKVLYQLNFQEKRGIIDF